MILVRVMLFAAVMALGWCVWPAMPCRAQDGEPTGTPETAAADQAERPETHRRWALGWDGGFGMRYRFAGHWGIGLSLDPSWNDRDRDEEHRSFNPRWESSGVAITEDSSRDDSYAISGFLFRERRIGRWLGVGPFVGLGYAYSLSNNQTTRKSTETSAGGVTVTSLDRQDGYKNRVWSFFAGIRPTFTFDERFVLESRFGLTVAYSQRERTYVWIETSDESGEVQVGGWGERSTDDGWSVDVFGSRLGPGSILSFMIYF